MLSTIYKILQTKIRPHVNYLRYSTLKYHSSCVMYGPIYRAAKFSDDEELKIRDTINRCTIDEFKKYDIKENQLKKLLAYREKNGDFKTFDDIIMTQDVPPLIKLCKSILSGERTSRRIKTPNTPKSPITPAIDEFTKKNIKKTLGLHVWGNQISWAMIDENRCLSNWDFTTFENPSKATLVPLINLIIKVVSELPYADAYVMESDQYTSLSKLTTALYAIHLQRQLVISIIINILGIRHRNEHNEIGEIKNFYMLQARTSARRYNLNVGSEIISANAVVENILAGSQSDNNQSLMPVEPYIITKYASNMFATREHLNTVLLVTLTFVDLVNNRELIKTLNIN